MTRSWAAVCCFSGFLLLMSAACPAAEEKRENGEGALWRYHATYRPLSGKKVKALDLAARRWVRWGHELEAPPPSADWAKPEFDDRGWPRRRAPLFGRYGGIREPGLALLCVRGRFGIEKDANPDDLNLAVTYRGGVVVYLNGKEIARGHLPAGDIDRFAPAEPYPLDAYMEPGGQKVLPTVGSKGPSANLLDRYESRLRTLTVSLPEDLLKTGVNVLALELHRTPLPKELLDPRKKPNWDTAGLVGVEFGGRGKRAVVFRNDSSTDFQVWNAEPMLRVGVDADRGDPFEPLGPIELLAPRNGLASGQVAISGVQTLGSIRGTVSELKSSAGDVIPVEALRVRYAQPVDDSGFVAMVEDAPSTGSIRSIWVSVKVPRDARPSAYTGWLEIEGLGKTTKVPVELTVYGWTVADPKDWKTCVNLLQSPESVAGYYRVPMWSDRHFELMAETMKLMGDCGNDVLGISAVRRNVFGDDPMLVFRKQGDKFVPELKFIRRYLELYDKYAGEPKFLSLHVWDYGMYQRGAGRDGGKAETRATTIPVMLLEDDRLVPIDIPIYGPETENLWGEAMRGLRDIVTGLGWREECILLGTSGDGWPSPTAVEMFKKAAPFARWRAITHGGGVPQWGETDEERTQPNAMVVGYLELVRRITNRRMKLPDHPANCNSRDCVKSDPFQYRSLPILNTMSANFDGFCWKGMDYWTYVTPAGTERNALNTYVHFGNIVGSTPRMIAAPGPNGALPTVQYEMLREGIQDAEALQFIRDALADERLCARIGGDLAGRCRIAMEEMLCMFETGARYSPHGGGDVRSHVRKIYGLAAEVAKTIGAEMRVAIAE